MQSLLDVRQRLQGIVQLLHDVLQGVHDVAQRLPEHVEEQRREHGNCPKAALGKGFGRS